MHQIRSTTSGCAALGECVECPPTYPSFDGADYLWVKRYAACVFPWIIFAVVAVPLVVVAFVASRRRTRAGEHPAGEDAQATALTEQEFAEAEAYEAKWREEDEKSYHEERLP
jgi:cytochrome c oxidase assembly factor CtaG